MNAILIGEHKFQTRILFIDRAAFSHSGIQNLLADTQIFRCYFKKFIGINKVKCLFEAENARRCQTKCFICAGRTCVSKMFCLTYVQFDIFSFTILSDNHTGIYFLTGSDEESTTLLGTVQTISYGFTSLKCDQGSLLTILDISFVWCISCLLYTSPSPRDCS